MLQQLRKSFKIKIDLKIIQNIFLDFLGNLYYYSEKVCFSLS